MSARFNLRASALSLTLLEDCYESFDVQVVQVVIQVVIQVLYLPQPIKSPTHLEVSYFLNHQIIQAWPVGAFRASLWWHFL
jgi:hypothetical protein